MNTTSFEVLTPAERVAALNYVFEGYVLPFHMSQAQFDVHVRANDVDLSASPVITDNGEIIAAALVALRENRSWIGGFGVSPTHRGKGFGHQLIEQCIESAKAHNARHMQLEVLQQNPAAIALYENAGFKRTRELLSFKVALNGHESTELKETTIQTLLETRTQFEPPCWQREPVSLRNQAQLYALQTKHAGAGIRRTPNVGQLSFISSDTQDDFHTLMQSVADYCTLENLIIFNEPADSNISKWSKAANWQIPFAQHEMHRPL